MRVLLISHIFPPAIDGGSKVVHKIGEYFESKHHDVLYVSSDCHSTDDFVNPNSKPIQSRLKKHLYLPVYKNFKKIFKLLYIFTKKDIFLILKKGPVFKIIPSIKTLNKIKKFNPEIIICGPLPTTTTIYASLLKKIYFPKSKLIINASFHESDPDFNRLPLLNVLKSANLIWTLTQHETNILTQRFQIKKDQTILLGNGVDQDLLHAKKINYTSNNILFIGSFAAHKNLKTLISAFQSLHLHHPKTTLILAGQNTFYFPEIQKQISELPTSTQQSIQINFEPNDKKIIELIDNCQFLIQPSLQESFGLTIIEANARKKPVIVSNIPSMSEIVSNTKSGLTFQSNSISDLTKKMEELITNSRKCRTLGENGYNYVLNNYTWSQIGGKLESVILTL